ncbi:hypothetical protein F3K21_18735 [Streptomyces scabiei]|nr:hypothetical protein F3K21_18735 [Streptomyces sp. LBUM 1480]
MTLPRADQPAPAATPAAAPSPSPSPSAGLAPATPAPRMLPAVWVPSGPSGWCWPAGSPCSSAGRWR